MFSRRTPDDLGPNPLARARLATGPPAFDLTVSNPTHVGIPYPEMPLPALAGGTGGAYDPDPAGIRSAREAVCRDYARRGIDVDPGRVVLTASSSEAYALLFKILCDPGDAILVPSPSYPLFEHLAAMEGIRTEPYRLVPELGWQPELHVPLPPAARAVVTVHPNNPTGSFVDREAASRIAGACASAGAAIVADEVFADFPLVPAIRVAS